MTEPRREHQPPFSQWPAPDKAELLEQLSLYARVLHEQGRLRGPARQLVMRLEAAAHNVATRVDREATREVRRQPWFGLPVAQKVERLRQIGRWAEEQGRWSRDLTQPERREHLALARHTDGLADVLDRRERERERSAR